MTKISIGTAQWGLNYGISNTAGIPSYKRLTEILDYARTNKIKMLDTAALYGEAESKLGKVGCDDFRIVTKITIQNHKNSTSIKSSIQNSLERLNQNSVYGCLIHNPELLINNQKEWFELQNEKNKGSVLKVGYSIYDVNTLEALFKRGMIPDIIQFPYNILDRKFESHMDLLKKHKVEIHVRSVFLQGLYFMNINEIPKKLEPLKETLKKLKGLCKSKSISMLDLCLSFVLNNKKIDFIVIGIEDINQLMQINEFFCRHDFVCNINEDDLDFNFNKNLLNPTNW